MTSWVHFFKDGVAGLNAKDLPRVLWKLVNFLGLDTQEMVDFCFGDFQRQSLESIQDSSISMPTTSPGSLPYSNVRSNGIGHPDPIGMSAGVLVLFYAIYSVYRYRREANRIISLFEANTQIKELQRKSM
eukprot:s1341_g26.t1